MNDKYKETLKNIIINLSGFYIAGISITLKPQDIRNILTYLRDYYDYIPEEKETFSIVEDLNNNSSLDW